jgi:hypothetical protein
LQVIRRFGQFQAAKLSKLVIGWTTIGVMPEGMVPRELIHAAEATPDCGYRPIGEFSTSEWEKPQHRRQDLGVETADEFLSWGKGIDVR